MTTPVYTALGQLVQRFATLKTTVDGLSQTVGALGAPASMLYDTSGYNAATPEALKNAVMLYLKAAVYAPTVFLWKPLTQEDFTLDLSGDTGDTPYTDLIIGVPIRIINAVNDDTDQTYHLTVILPQPALENVAAAAAGSVIQVDSGDSMTVFATASGVYVTAPGITPVFRIGSGASY